MTTSDPTSGAGSSMSGESPGRTATALAWPRWRRITIGGVILFVAVLVPVVVRVALEGRAELARAQEMAEYGSFDDQVLHLGRAARWRLPGVSHDDEALAQLMMLAREREQLGGEGFDDALVAYREVRRALIATRTFGVADPDLLQEANERIAVLMGEQERALGMSRAEAEDPATYHRELLEELPGPDPWRSRLAALAFVGWAIASGGFVLLGIDARGRLRVKAATRWGLAAVLLLVGWIFAFGP